MVLKPRVLLIGALAIAAGVFLWNHPPPGLKRGHEHTIRLALMRYLMKDDAGRVPACVSVEGRDPDPDLLLALAANSRPVLPGSHSTMDPEGLFIHRKSKIPVVRYEVGPIRWINPVTVEAEGRAGDGMMGSTWADYKLRLWNGRWSVVGQTNVRVS